MDVLRRHGMSLLGRGVHLLLRLVVRRLLLLYRRGRMRHHDLRVIVLLLLLQRLHGLVHHLLLLLHRWLVVKVRDRYRLDILGMLLLLLWSLPSHHRWARRRRRQ